MLKHTRIITLTAMTVILSLPLFAQAANDRQVSVSASGQVAAMPDIAIVKGRIVSQEKSAKQAMKVAHKKLTALIDYTLAQGVASKDVNAAQVLVTPQWHYPKNKPRVISGYQGHAEFTIKLRQLEQLSPLYAGLVDAGANDLRPTQFDFSQREQLELKAIEQAMLKAQRKAKTAVSALQEKVGEVQSINIDTHWQQPQPRMMRMEMASDRGAAKANKVNVGHQTITANVSVVFSID